MSKIETIAARKEHDRPRPGSRLWVDGAARMIREASEASQRSIRTVPGAFQTASGTFADGSKRHVIGRYSTILRSVRGAAGAGALGALTPGGEAGASGAPRRNSHECPRSPLITAEI
jgi:hypothetical protein